VTDAPVDAGGLDAGREDEEGDVENAVVGEKAVVRLVLLSERFAVVRGEDDDRLRERAA
jgi:hypothetical protein